MEKDILVVAFTYLSGIGFLLIINEIIYRKCGIKGEISRKIAHFLATLATIPFPYLFNSHWYVLVLAGIFFLILITTKRSKKLGSIHDIKRKSMGSYLLPVAIYLTFYVSTVYQNKLLYILPMLILAISDPLAAIVGIGLEKFNHRIIIFKYDTHKSLFGTLTFLLSSLFISIIAIYFVNETLTISDMSLAITVAIVSSITELFCQRGLDNVFIPLSVILVLVIL